MKMTSKFSKRIKDSIMLAPLAGITDLPFRKMCLDYGASLVTIPMINCNALVRNNKATIRLLRTVTEEKPKSVQLFGSRIGVIKKAARIAVDATGCDVLDFNMGCPDKDIISQGAGAALLKRPKKIEEIVKALKSSVDVPVSVKIRIGGGTKSINVFENAKIIEKAGADILTVHARTISQSYSGNADWNIISDIHRNSRIFLVGNGDIRTYEDAKNKLKFCDSVMVGRGSLGNPGIFSGRKTDRKKMFEIYYNYARSYDDLDYSRLKYHAMCFTKGLEKGTEIRKRLTHSKDICSIIDIMSNIKE